MRKYKQTTEIWLVTMPIYNNYVFFILLCRRRIFQAISLQSIWIWEHEFPNKYKDAGVWVCLFPKMSVETEYMKGFRLYRQLHFIASNKNGSEKSISLILWNIFFFPFILSMKKYSTHHAPNSVSCKEQSQTETKLLKNTHCMHKIPFSFHFLFKCLLIMSISLNICRRNIL